MSVGWCKHPMKLIRNIYWCRALRCHRKDRLKESRYLARRKTNPREQFGYMRFTCQILACCQAALCPSASENQDCSFAMQTGKTADQGVRMTVVMPRIRV